MSEVDMAEGLVEYVVPLVDYERRLIDDLTLLLAQIPSDSGNEVQRSYSDAFLKWRWPSYIKKCLSDDLDGESLEQDYHGDRVKAYESFLHWLTQSDTEQNGLARVEILRRVNADFVARLGSRAIEEVRIRPADEDIKQWNVIATFDEIFNPTWKHDDFLQRRRSGQFEIFEWARKCSFGWEYSDNAEIVDKLLVQHPRFQAIFKVKRNESLLEDSQYTQFATEELPPILSINHRPISNVRSVWPEDKIQYDENGHLTNEALTFMLKKAKETATPALEDPGKYVHYIPWDNLQHVGKEELISAKINLDIPFYHDDPDRQFVLWSPPYSGFLWNHHLYTEDQVFDLNVSTGWSFPDHYMNERVIFSVRAIEDTDFISTLSDYWELWNDCAISQKDPAGPVLLLETLPGQRFRSRNKFQDRLTALTYFRNLAENYDFDEPQGKRLAEVLGLNSQDLSFLKYQHSLRLIPESEISDINWAQPLGRGANGAVYAAIWHEPQARLPTNKLRPREQAVVLKEILPRVGTNEDQVAKVLREVHLNSLEVLEITYTSIVGRVTGCVKFHGITSLSKEPGAPPKILLVFERATRGHVLDFLAKQFEASSFLESFDILLTALGSVGSGISSLHKHNVLHRDLHLGNIMVTDRYFSTDPIPHEFGYIITDIGEGKILQESEFETLSMDHWASYGATDFRAPEVNGRDCWSSKAEVFSFGVIATKFLDCRRSTCNSQPPEWVLQQMEQTYPSILTDTRLQAHIVPQSLKNVLEPCLNFQPNSRQEMHPVVLGLNGASDEFFSEDPDRFNKTDLPIKWTVWFWNESKASGRRREMQVVPPDGGINESDEAKTTSMNIDFTETSDPMDFF